MVRLNGQEEPMQATCEDVAYFRYKLPAGIRYDNHWVMLQIEPKSRVAAYVHWSKLPGP